MVEAGAAGAASAKHARSFGAQPALVRTAGKGPYSAFFALGRPPERREVGSDRAFFAPPRFWLCRSRIGQHGGVQNLHTPSQICTGRLIILGLI